MLPVKKIEKEALWINVIASLIMAIAGWVFYYATRAEALLFDGNISFVAMLTGLLAIYIASVKDKRTQAFPYGQYNYEALFVFFKGIVTLGVIVTALIDNGLKISRFLAGKELAEVIYGPIFYYAAAMSLLGFGLSYYFWRQEIKLKGTSPIVSMERKGAMIDGTMSLAVGFAFLMITFIPEESNLAFLHQIGDAILVIVLCVFFIKIPLTIIASTFREVGGGVLADKKQLEEILGFIEEKIDKHFTYEKSFVNKAGSSYLAIIYLTPKRNEIKIDEVRKMKKNITDQLVERYNFTDIEIIIN